MSFLHDDELQHPSPTVNTSGPLVFHNIPPRETIDATFDSILKDYEREKQHAPLQGSIQLLSPNTTTAKDESTIAFDSPEYDRSATTTVSKGAQDAHLQRMGHKTHQHSPPTAPAASEVPVSERREEEHLNPALYGHDNALTRQAPLPARSFLVHVLLNEDTTTNQQSHHPPLHSDERATESSAFASSLTPKPLVPPSVIVNVSATNKVEFVEILEDTLAMNYGVMTRIRSFSFRQGISPQAARADGHVNTAAASSGQEHQYKWTVVNEFNDELYNDVAAPENVHDKVHQGDSHQAAALGIPATQSPQRANKVAVPFHTLPLEMTVRLQVQVRRLTFVVSCLYSRGDLQQLVSGDATAQDQPKLFQRRASVFVDSIQSLSNALAPLVHHHVHPSHVLFVNPLTKEDQAKADGTTPSSPTSRQVFTPLQHIGQLEDFCFLMCNFLSGPALELNPHHGLSNGAATTTTPTGYVTVNDPTMVKRLGGVLQLDDRFLAHDEAHVTSELIRAKEEAAANKNQSELVDMANAIAPRMRFSIPRCVKTPHLPENSPPAANNTEADPAALSPLNGLRREELDAAEAERKSRALDLPKSSVLPVPNKLDAPRQPIDLYRDVFVESLARFPQAGGGGSNALKTPVPKNLGSTGPVGTLDERGEKKALVQIALHMCMAHPRHDFFSISQMVGMTSDIVQEFRRQYPAGLAVRFPLSTTDKNDLSTLVSNRIGAELTTGAKPFRGSARNAAGSGASPNFREYEEGDSAVQLGRAQQEQLRFEQQRYAGATGGASTSFGGNVTTPTAARNPPMASLSSTLFGDVPIERQLVVTKPNWHAAAKKLVVVASCGFDILDGTSEALVTQKVPGSGTEAIKRKLLAGSTYAAKGPYTWYLLRGLSNSKEEVSLEALFALGLAKSYIVSHIVPITITLELNFDFSAATAHRMRDSDVLPSPLQEGIPYTIGIVARHRDHDGAEVHATQTFVVPVGTGLAPEQGRRAASTTSSFMGAPGSPGGASPLHHRL